MNFFKIDEFDSADKIAERDMQDYQSIYIDLWHEIVPPDNKDGKENINDDIIRKIKGNLSDEQKELITKIGLFVVALAPVLIIVGKVVFFVFEIT